MTADLPESSPAVATHRLDPNLAAYALVPHEGTCEGTLCPECGCCTHCLMDGCGCTGCADDRCECKWRAA